MIQQKYAGLLADVLLIVHVVFAAFIVFGLFLIIIGGICKWRWIRNFWLRLFHLFATVWVAIESWCGVICPLTDWEMRLREISGQDTYGGGFIAYWLQRLLYYDAPAWVFVLCYILFGLAVIGCWIMFRPRRY
jgi:hypothetical protein